MKFFFAAPVLILVFFAVLFAQTKQVAKCSEISVLGPAAIVEPGDIAQFTAVIKNGNLENYTYKWTVTGGIIIGEQGNDLGAEFEEKGKYFVKLLLSSNIPTQPVSATVEIKGLPDGCPNTASEALVICGLQAAKELDEFSISATQIAKAKLNNLAIELQNNPSAQIYIIERFEKNTLPKTIERKKQKTIDYLKENGMDVSRFTFVNGYSDKNLTQIFLVPSGASAPICDDCITVEPK